MRRSTRVNILLVGDIERWFDVDRTVLRRNDICIAQTDPSPEVLNFVQREEVDLIALEATTAEPYGVELSRELKSLPMTEDLPVVLVVDRELRVSAQQSRADAILYRPAEAKDLLAAIGRFTRLKERRHDRFPINLRFTFMSGGRTGQAFSRVISRSGVFLKTDLPVPRGARLELRFRLPGEDLDIDCTGVVRNTRIWVEDAAQGPGFGVEFEELSEADRRRLDDFVDTLIRRPILG